MKYVLQYSEICDSTLGDFISLIKQPDLGKPLNELLLRDLIINSVTNELIYPGNGVYFFSDKTKLIYVGKASSKSFTERIGGHFDPRSRAWFNSLIKHKNFPNQKDDTVLEEQARYAYSTFRITLVNFDDVYAGLISKFEGLMRKSLNVINQTKGRIDVNMFEEKLEDILSI